MKTYRSLTQEEIQQLKERSCTAVDWDEIEVVENFKTDYIYHTRFSGKVRLGVFEDEFTLAGGMRKHSGLYHATLHNVTVGDNCCIENIKNYIANYIIGDYVFIENVDIILVDGRSKFGNGVEVAVLNETGGREVPIHDRLSAHQAYILALYGMNVIDCGVPVLSMHAPWEICSKSDIYETEKAYEAFFKNC